MQRRTAIATTIALLFLALPLASADWMGRGFYEPDTEFDRTSGFMWTTPDTSAAGADHVYFSAFAAYYVATPNHNSATLGSNIAPYPTNIHAVLGLWKDCNQDGYIGHVEGALSEYRAELLLDDSVCGVDSSLPTHNDGEWVREFLAIGPDFQGQGESSANNSNPYNIPDEGALIWGDWGIPTDGTKASCPVNPRPRGTYQSTGGFVRYADCIASWRVNGAVNTAAALTGLSQISFADAPQERPDQSGSVLNQQNPWGHEEDDSAVAYDCTAPAFSQGDPADVVPDDELDENGNILTLYAPTGVGGGGSAAGTINATEEATGNCDRGNDNNGYNTQGYSEIAYADEGTLEGTTPKRALTDVYFQFFEGSSINRVCDGGDPSAWQNVDTAPVVGDEPTCVDLSTTVPSNTPDDGGQAVAEQLVGASTWFGAPGYAVSRNPYASRDDLQPWGAVHFTAYAWVTPSLFTGGLPSAAQGVYGSPHCDGSVEITGAFNCDSAKWWLNPDGTDARTLFQVLPGQPYNLIDIDCYDASAFKGSPVTTSLVGPGACSR
jgi:hypothetical protein